MSAFYESQGFIFGQNREKIRKKLKRLMGNERYEHYSYIADAKIAENVPAHDQYSTVNTVPEANCLMSFQSGVMLQSHRCLLELCEPYLTPGTVVVELGCWPMSILSRFREK